MSSHLLTRCVMLDANIFVAANFYYGGRSYATLRDLALEERAWVYTVDIVDQEVRAQIREKVRRAAAAAKRFRKDAAVLAELRMPGLQDAFSRLDKEAIEERLWAGHHALLEQCGATVIPVDRARPSAVFQRYFERTAPFDQEGVKSEFPDAFWIAALDAWAEAEGRAMYVVTRDERVLAACARMERLYGLSSIEEFLALVLEEDNRVAKRMRKWLDANHEALAGGVAEAFARLHLSTDLYEAAVNLVEVEHVTIKSVQLYWAAERSGTASVEAVVRFAADVTYEEEGSGVWGRYEAAWVNRAHVTKRAHRTVLVPVEAFLKLSDSDAVEFMGIETLSIDSVEIPFYGDDEPT